MRDSFNNEIQVGDRILCIEPREFNRHRKNQIGTIAEMNCNRLIVNYDFYEGRGWSHPELNIQSGHGNCLIPDQDIFIKVESHTEVEYRVRDKVLCYCTTISNIPFIGTVVEELHCGVCKIVDEQGNYYILTNSEILFLLERKHFKIGDEIVVQKTLNFELLFGEGYNQSIPARVNVISTPNIVIKIDSPSIGWQRNGDTIHSYWTLTDTKKLLPKEFSYSLPLVEYLKCYNPEIFNSFEQTNSTEETSTEENEVASNDVSNESTPNLVHNYSYTPDKTRFFGSEDEEDNENNLYLGIELEISGSSQESDNEEDAREILKAIQKDVEDTKNSVYFKHEGSINGFEIVFHPHSLRAYNEYNWKEIFSTIRKLGYTNDDRKAGFHVHISRSYFGDESQQNEALAKLVFLMYKFKTEIEPLAGRKDSEYATYNTIGLETAKRNDFYGTFYWYSKNSGKYSAINSQHKDTFEIRIFDGVTNEQRLVDILSFIESLCNIVKNTSPTDIAKIRIEDFMSLSQSMEELS